MNKPKFEPPNRTAENMAKLAEMFPGVVTEGKVNIDLLRSLVGEEVFGDKAYEFTWVGKRDAIAEAGRPIRKTLRPCVEESKNWDTTENLYIEGDNLDVLKLLQESYLGKVKMIYIDPPYNTGNDFVYRDNFTADKDEYDEEAGVYDEDGDRLFRNTETNRRFHSDWCSMIYPRLVMARNMLRDDGFIFISIDDNEVDSLKKVCDETLGAENFIAHFIWHSRQNADSRALDGVSNDHEFVLCYSKQKGNRIQGKAINTDKYSNPDNDPRGPWMSSPMDGLAAAELRPNLHYSIENPETKKIYNPNPANGWRFQRSTVEQLIREQRIIWPKNDASKPRFKRYLNELSNQFTGYSTILDVDFTLTGTKELRNLMDMETVKFPKPVSLPKAFILQASDRDSIILDFFSGSATTAHAVMQLNTEDGGKRKFIMVQIPELTDKSSESAKVGYTNICEIGKERIRRAGEKIKEEAGLTAPNLDIGFRVLKLADTNMNDVYYMADEVRQDTLFDAVSNIKPDRTDMDLLFGCLLDWGLPLSMPHTHEDIGGFTVHTYNNGDLIACFDEHISETAIREIANRQPLRAVFRDSGFVNSPQKINVFEIFKLLAPNTTVRVI